MKIKQIQEARYDGHHSPGVYVIYGEDRPTNLVGPFGSTKDAKRFSDHLLNWELHYNKVITSMSPEEALEEFPID